jgi:hypothetical protein
MSCPAPRRELTDGARRRGHGALLSSLAAAVFLLGGVVAYGVAASRADRALAASVRLLERDIGELDARRDPRRAPLLPAWDGGDDVDAAEDYAVVEWFLADPPPAGPAPRRAARLGITRSAAWVSAARNLRPIAGMSFVTMLDRGVAPTPEMRAALELHAPLLRCVRDAVGRRSCAWGSAEEAVFAPSTGAGVIELAFAAEAEAPAEAARTGLVLVAYARDLLRHPSVVTVNAGEWALHIGARALARAMNRGLGREGYVEVSDALGRLEPIDLRPAAEGARLRALIEVARRSGRLLPQGASPPSPWARARDALRLHDRWSSLEEEIAVERQTLGMDVVARRRFVDRVLRPRPSMVLCEGTSFCGFDAVQDYTVQSEVESRMARVLAAAHLHRLATGAFPLDPADLDVPLPEDPFAPGSPVRYRAMSDEVRVWSRGLNLLDEGGTGDDVLLEAHAVR